MKTSADVVAQNPSSLALRSTYFTLCRLPFRVKSSLSLALFAQKAGRISDPGFRIIYHKMNLRPPQYEACHI